MSLPPRPPFPSLIPESAPFSAEQRVWLDGLFAGLLSLEHGVTPLSRRTSGGAAAGRRSTLPRHRPRPPTGR